MLVEYSHHTSMTVLHALINNLLGGQILCGIIHILGIAFEVTAYRYFNVPFPQEVMY